MGTYVYLARNDTKELFELGKSAYAVIRPDWLMADQRGFVPATVEDWKKRFADVFNDPPTDHDVAKSTDEYHLMMAQAAFSFAHGGTSFYMIDDAGALVDVAVARGYQLVGSVYWLDQPEKFADHLRSVNTMFNRYRMDSEEIRRSKMEYDSAVAMGWFEELGPPR